MHPSNEFANGAHHSHHLLNLSHDTSATSTKGTDQQQEENRGALSMSTKGEKELPNNNFFSTSSQSHHQPSEFNLNLVKMVSAEFVGTFILVFSICGVIASMKELGTKLELLEYAITAGSAIVLAVYTVGPISGAHINPAGTVAFAIWGHFPWIKVPFYVGAQILGSLMATYVGKVVYVVEPELLLTQPIQSATSAFWTEFIASFLMLFLATSLARDTNSVGQLSGLVMGIAVALAVLITGPISGASLNPARSLGPAIIAGKFNQIWIYFLAPTSGAFVGVSMVHVLCVNNHQPCDGGNSTDPSPVISSLLSCRTIQTE